MIYPSAFHRFVGINAKLLYCAILMIMPVGCVNTTDKTADVNTTKATRMTFKSGDREIAKTETVKKSDSLLYQSSTFNSYVDSTKRGSGIISFTLNVQDRLDIWNADDSKFGEIILNEDLTYFTLNMPRKVIARKVIPDYDFAAFDFDAEKPDTEKDYLIIYVNKEKRKVRKSELKFTFTPW